MAEFTKTVTVNCPYCESTHVVKNGLSPDKDQRYLCRRCSRRFTDKGGTDGLRFPPNQVGAAVRMFYSGMSYKQIAESMEEQYDIPEPSKATIYRWVQEYTDRALDHMRDHKAQTGDEWVADEMVVKVGGENYWNWNVMDSDTRYILASYLSKTRDARAAKVVFRKAIENAASIPKTIKTDRLRAYESAIEDVFGADVKHVQSDGIRELVNNNLSERLQGTFRARTKTLRGMDSRKTGQQYLDGWVLTYNLFREHEALGNKSPAEVAKVRTPYDSWQDVVESPDSDMNPTIQIPSGADQKNTPLPDAAPLRPSGRNGALPKTSGRPQQLLPREKVEMRKPKPLAAPSGHAYYRRKSTKSGRRK